MRGKEANKTIDYILYHHERYFLNMASSTHHNTIKQTVNNNGNHPILDNIILEGLSLEGESVGYVSAAN